MTKSTHGLKKPELKTVLSSDAIQKMVAKLAAEISSHYEKILSAEEELLVVITLKGAFLFAADLVRRITPPCKVDFVRVSSYGSQTISSGSVRIVKDIEMSVQGRHVLVLDEIIDTGRTLKFLLERLKASGPKSLKTCTLLNKPSRREVPLTPDFVGTEVADQFLVGYGLDFNEKYRHLGEIYVIDP